MKIEDVEAIKYGLDCVAGGHGPFRDTAYALIEALRAEAWHPIEKAEELGAKDGREILTYGSYKNGRTDVMLARFYAGHNDWICSRGLTVIPTHFRFISPPEGA